MKNKKILVLCALVLVIGVVFADTTYANPANGESRNVIKPAHCCCDKCNCINCHCACKDGNCVACKDHGRLNSILGHFFCKCCKHPVNS